jgi:hypothetical protein
VGGVRAIRLAAGALVVACVAGAAPPASVPAAPQNPIQIENAQPGTTAWQSPDTDSPAIEGYASQVSALPGDTIQLHVSTRPSAEYRVEIYRLGWYGGAGGRLMMCLPSCTGTETGHAYPPGKPGQDGIVQANWPVTDQLTVPSTWTSGYYMVRFQTTSGVTADTYVIVRAPPTYHSQILVQVPVNTWQAYNGWGGMSLYEFSYANYQRASRVSFDRPYAWHLEGGQSPLVWEIQTVRYLERNGYDVSYQTDADTDANPQSLLDHRLVIVNGHDEYWTKGMFDAFDAARGQSTNYVFMGANAAYWQVRYEDNDRTIVSYKSFSDPIADPALKTVRFRELNPPRYECALIGIQSQGVGLNWPPGDYTAQAPAVSDPWMASTGFKAGDVVPGVVSVESDTIPGNQTAASSCTHSLTVFFHRQRIDDKDGNADVTRYTDPSGSRVFASGSHQWSWALDSFRGEGQGTSVPADTRVQKFMANALDDLTRPAPPSAVTAVAGKGGVTLGATVLADPRVTGVRFLRDASGTAACAGTTGCVDHPPGHRTYTYEAETVDRWGTSYPALAKAVHVPDTPPTVRLLGRTRVRVGRRYVYRAVVFDRDGDVVRLRWTVGGALRPGTRSLVVRFLRPGRTRIAVTANDGFGGTARATQTAIAR